MQCGHAVLLTRRSSPAPWAYLQLVPFLQVPCSCQLLHREVLYRFSWPCGVGGVGPTMASPRTSAGCPPRSRKFNQPGMHGEAIRKTQIVNNTHSWNDVRHGPSTEGGAGFHTNPLQCNWRPLPFVWPVQEYKPLFFPTFSLIFK